MVVQSQSQFPILFVFEGEQMSFVKEKIQHNIAKF